MDKLLRQLVEQGYAGAVTLEVGTRKRSVAEREADLAEALEFARTHLARQCAPADPSEPEPRHHPDH